MAILNPKVPLQADHRYLKKLTSVVLGGKAEPRPEEFDRVSRVFLKLGGSWERLFKGSPDEVDRIRRVLKVAFKKGYLTKKENWS